MDQEFTIKQYPKTTAEVAAMFNLPISDSDFSDSEPAKTASPQPANLPVAEIAAHMPAIKFEPVPAPAGSENFFFSQIAGNLYVKKSGQDKGTETAHQPLASAAMPVNPALKYIRLVIPYAIVFFVGLFMYYFFFVNANLNLTGLFNSVPKAAQTSKQSELSQLEQADLAGYQQWIAGFYYDVTDSKILDPEADNSGNGLTNFQKYLLNLNPKSYDSLGLGRADSESLAMNLNPLTGNVLTDQQKQIVDKYFDMEVVMNKLTLANMQNARNVAGATTFSGAGAPIGSYSGNNFGNYQGFSASPAANSQNHITPREDSVSAAVIPVPLPEPVNVNAIDINTNTPGRLEIPSLNVNAPIMWTDDPKNFDRDLKSGVVHYPGTALPGQIGTAYISGHSSNYVWAGGNFNHVFTHLDNLADNTSFKVTVVQKNGKDAILHYVVTGRKEYAPTDQAQFQNSGKSVIALSTCWPVGSTAKRLVVFGELMQVEK